MRQLGMALVAVVMLCAATALWAAQSRNKVGGGYIVYPAEGQSPGPVVFSHLTHGTTEAGFVCSDCHSTSATSRWTVSKHRDRQMRTCAACHRAKMKAPKTGNAAPPAKDCKACHMPAQESLIEVNSIGSVPFSHVKHTGEVVDGKTVEHGGLSCGACHPDPYAAEAGLSMAMTYPHGTDSCGVCHNGVTESVSGQPVFTVRGNCARCHRKDSSVMPEGAAGQP